MITRIMGARKTADFYAGYFHTHSTYLQSGNYLVANERIFYRNDPETIGHLKNLFGIDHASSRAITGYRQLAKRILIPSSHQVQGGAGKAGFDGTIFYLPLNRKCIKIFNFNTREILTVYDDNKHLEKTITDYTHFTRYFRIPTILSSNLDELTIVEELVRSRHQSLWTQSDQQRVNDAVFDAYEDYYSLYGEQGSVQASNVSNMLERLDKDPILSKVSHLLERALPDSLLSVEMPCIRQHGDLWASNILLSQHNDRKIYVIDWEHAGQYCFLFDLFRWMEKETIGQPSRRHLGKYRTGAHDDYFDRLFARFGLDYQPAHRDSYYYLYIIDYLYRRVMHRSDVRKREVKNLYTGLMNELMMKQG